MKKSFSTVCLLLISMFAIGQEPQLQQDLALKYIVQLPAERSAKTPVIILLHGYGSDEMDLFNLKSFFPKNYLIVSARAPHSAGTKGYQWFESSNHDGKSAQLTNSRNLVIKFISQVTAKYKADTKAVYLMGFSQGAMMSYEIGLTNPDKLKGIGVLSGRIFALLKPEIKNTTALKQLKIFISHGAIDDRIKFTDAKASYDYLKTLGLKPEFHEYPGMGHNITNAVMMDLVRWLQLK